MMKEHNIGIDNDRLPQGSKQNTKNTTFQITFFVEIAFYHKFKIKIIGILYSDLGFVYVRVCVGIGFGNWQLAQCELRTHIIIDKESVLSFLK